MDPHSPTLHLQLNNASPHVKEMALGLQAWNIAQSVTAEILSLSSRQRLQIHSVIWLVEETSEHTVEPESKFISSNLCANLALSTNFL